MVSKSQWLRRRQSLAMLGVSYSKTSIIEYFWGFSGAKETARHVFAFDTHNYMDEIIINHEYIR